MQELKVINGLVLVEKYDKIRKSRDDSPFSTLATNDSLGVVKALDPSVKTDSLKPGVKVYYGNKYDRIFVGGVELYSMKLENVIAIAEDSSDEQTGS
jgi:hypothetical protein